MKIGRIGGGGLPLAPCDIAVVSGTSLHKGQHKPMEIKGFNGESGSRMGITHRETKGNTKEGESVIGCRGRKRPLGVVQHAGVEGKKKRNEETK